MSETKVMIGLEIHTYLDTKSKLFCSCSTDILEALPNSVTCPVCLSHPGSKPVLNAKAVEHAIKVGFALNCDINKDFFFSRKTYFYPDMAANYQITQYEIPVAKNGFVMLKEKKIGITRAHLELDPAALVHPNGMGTSNYSLIDYNRSGFPLLEIVTEPDLTSPSEARDFLKNLENILSYLKVLMPRTTLKVDCNVSINGGNRVEIKNVSGFAAAEKALTYEIKRQERELELGNKLEQHTRAYDTDAGKTLLLRKKETEADYGYIFDPDLVKVSLEKEQIEKIKSEMPELPKQKQERFVNEFGLSDYEANVLCSELELGNLFEELIKKEADAKLTSQLLTRELLSIMNHDSLTFNDLEVNVTDLLEVIKLLSEGKVNDRNVKKAMINYISGDKEEPVKYLEENDLLVNDSIDVDKIVLETLEGNEEAVADYQAGNEKVLNFLAGLIMRETKGAVRIDEVMEKLKEKLSV